MIEFYSETLDLRVRFTDDVAQRLLKHRQIHGKMEAGGLLFTDLPDSGVLSVVDVSTPSFFDFRRTNRFSVHPSRAQKIINEKFKNDLHFVGDWHSHPEPRPSPSYDDLSTIKKVFKKSDHELNYLLMLIIGSTESLSDAYVALTDGENIFPCEFRKLLGVRQ